MGMFMLSAEDPSDSLRYLEEKIAAFTLLPVSHGEVREAEGFTGWPGMKLGLGRTLEGMRWLACMHACMQLGCGGLAVLWNLLCCPQVAWHLEWL